MTGQQFDPSASRAIALAAETLHRFGRLSLRVTGASMLPALRPGDVLQFESFNVEYTEPGDVVLYRRDGRMVAHRVLTRTIIGLLTQGDALAQPDSPVHHDDVLGRVVGLSRCGRSLSHRRSSRLRDHLSRWLFRRFDLATGLFLHWQRLSARKAA